VDWSKLPDLVAVALLACAFASVVRSSHTSVSKLWLTGWILIAVHFAAFMLTGAQPIWGAVGTTIGLASLISAGLLFMWASVPYREEISSQWMHWTLLCLNVLYVIVLTSAAPAWLLNLVAILFAVAPLTIALVFLPSFKNLLRWTTVLLYCVLAVFLLFTQNRPGSGSDLALNGVLSTVYLGCAILFWHAYRRATAGAFITIAGFFAWSGVFVVAPLLAAFRPQVHLESEVWNLPKYVVAVGMILILLEDQIEHNKYLALHDELTSLPNRRLFQDRLSNAVARACRLKTQTALLVIDLNRFKEVNDTLGHHAGDLVLQRVASVFAGRVRRSDTVARTGGDEFSVILEEPTNYAEAESVVRSLMELLVAPIQIEDCAVQIGASVGIAICPDDATDTESLCRVADMRMYGDKNSPTGGVNAPGFANAAPRPVFRSPAKDSFNLSPEEEGS